MYDQWRPMNAVVFVDYGKVFRVLSTHSFDEVFTKYDYDPENQLMAYMSLLRK